MMTLLIQILFFLVVYIIFFRSHDTSQEYAEVSIRKALDRIRSAWDYDELKHVFYEEVNHFPHLQHTLYNAYLSQQRILQGLALEEPWAYNEVRHYMREKLAQCRNNPEMINFLRWQFANLLRRHPSLNDVFTNTRTHQTTKPAKKHLFSMCNSIPEVKKRFRKLAFLNHPDRGGSSAAMQEIIRQYEEALESQKQR